MTPELAAHMIRFLSEPTSRTYMHHLPGRAGALPLVRGGRARSASAAC